MCASGWLGLLASMCIGWDPATIFTNIAHVPNGNGSLTVAATAAAAQVLLLPRSPKSFWIYYFVSPPSTPAVAQSLQDHWGRLFSPSERKRDLSCSCKKRGKKKGRKEEQQQRRRWPERETTFDQWWKPYLLMANCNETLPYATISTLLCLSNVDLLQASSPGVLASVSCSFLFFIVFLLSLHPSFQVYWIHCCRFANKASWYIVSVNVYIEYLSTRD